MCFSLFRPGNVKHDKIRAHDAHQKTNRGQIASASTATSPSATASAYLAEWKNASENERIPGDHESDRESGSESLRGHLRSVSTDKYAHKSNLTTVTA